MKVDNRDKYGRGTDHPMCVTVTEIETTRWRGETIIASQPPQ